MTPEERVKEILKDFSWSPYMNYRPEPKDDGVRECLLRHIQEAIADEREACRQECLNVLSESNNLAASACAWRIQGRSK